MLQGNADLGFVGVTSINISLTLTLDVRLFNLGGRCLLTTHVEWIRRNGFTVGFRCDYRLSSSLTVNSRVQSAIHSVLTTRVVLNIREAASRRLNDVSCDLHLSDLEFPKSRISFAETPVVSHFGSDRESDTFSHRERSGSTRTAQTGMASTPNSVVASHINLPVTRDAEGKRVVGRPEPDDDKDDDDGGSTQVAYDEWV